MKKQVVFIIAIFFSALSFCQNQAEEVKPENDLRFGIKAGIAMANNLFENKFNSSDYTYKVGGMGGVFLRTPLGNTLYFQPELLMVGKGTKQKNQGFDYRIDLTYLELPLNVLYKSSNTKVGFFIGGGPAPSVFIGENLFYFGNQTSKSFDFGINVLTGFELPIGFSINLNYTHGLLNVTADKENIPMIKNRSFGLTVGYLFR
jgi:hypothetical protein